jgi:16S rRNA (adenine1518-N6/adenine1519-N6)-dimethyltransferase
MYQREFAARMVARPGNKTYGRLTVSVYCRADVKPLEEVPSTSFHPEPKVDSTIVLVLPREIPFQVIDRSFFDRVVEAAFSQRRKMIKNSLENRRSWLLKGGGKEFDWSGIPFSNKRPEQLSPQQLGEIADYIHETVEGKRG